ncbi:leucyl aminopeptidase [Microbacteriaceae bacterium VKM Ac-2855]|nr:leucyl aminopeptidase [Microbacteriaceae bacterium VKM Ac-2855]
MPLSSLVFSTAPATRIDADALVLGVAAGPDGPRLLAGDEFAPVAAQLVALGVTGNVETIQRVPALVGAARVIVLVGLGSAEPTSAVLRGAAGLAVRTLTGHDSIAMALPAGSDAELAAVAEGAALGSYAYSEYRSSTKATVKAPVSNVTVVTAGDADDAIADRALAIASAVAVVKDLVNAPPSHLYPETLADAVIAGAAGLPLEVTVWDEHRLAQDGFGGILGVGSGSSRPPRLVKVSYAPEGATKHLALVGKGITFDSGGLSLKPPTSMIGMKYDMTGAATVYAVVKAAAELSLPVRLTAWLCIAENMPSGTATRPNDVLTIRGGTTVEVLNTDAEGRLVLADGLVAASEEEPDAIVDVATLTGAAVVALGNRYTGVMGEGDVVAGVLEAARASDELFWHMPLPAELRPLLNSDVADIANIKPGNTAGGMLIAAQFLRDFVGSRGEGDDAKRIPWAHLDIAGPAQNSGAAYGFTGSGPTGVSVRALLTLAEHFAHA